jgi:hypothetical protein
MDNFILDKNIKKIKFNDIKAKSFSYYSIYDFLNYKNLENSLFLYSESWFDFHYFNFQYINDVIPNVYSFKNIGKQFIEKFIKEINPPITSYTKKIYEDEDNKDINIMYIDILLEKDIFLSIEDEDIKIFYHPKYERDLDNENNKLHILIGLIKNFIDYNLANKIYIVYRTSYGFDKKPFDVKKIDISIEDNYNDDFKEVHEKILKTINNKNQSGLYIFSGLSGSGKTYFLRYLASKIKKPIIFIPSDIVQSIIDPSFIRFLMDNNDSILIIEDAEPVLETRDSNRTNAVSNILNLTDGLLSDCLNMSIICTFNTDSKNIDKALLRKGRLLINYKFEKLSIEKCRKLFEKLGHKNINVKEPMTLADIYNYYDTNNYDKQETTKIGFTK